MEKGLKVKEVHVGEDFSKIFIVKTNKLFDKNNYKEYEEKLNEAKEFRRIDGQFDDNIWVVHEFNSTSTLKFPLETNSDMNIALKCFAVIYLKEQNIDSASLRMGINKIVKILLMTNYLNPEYIYELEEYLIGFSNAVKYTTSSWLLRFISFYGGDRYEEYKKLLEKNRKVKSGYRVLPKYKSIIHFDFILNDYMNRSTKEQKEEYFPLLLWWTITRTIPLRPTEFTKIRKDCVYYDDKTESYYLVLNREKQSSTPDNMYKIPIENTVKITKDIYDLVLQYLELIEGVESDEYLLSYKSYLRYVKINQSHAKYNPDYYSINQLEYLLDRFYEEVIEKEYKYKVTSRSDGDTNTPDNKSIYVDDLTIDKIELGDTRHFAFCSLILQGLNKLTIARLGGHTDLETQTGYYSHLDNFVECNVYVLSDAIKKERDYVANSVFDTNEIVVRSKIKGNKSSNQREVEGGICLSTNFPEECLLTDCIYCKNFILDLSRKNASKERLSDMSNKLKNEISVQLELLKKVSEDTYVDRRDMKLDEMQAEYLKTVSKKLQTLIGQKALVESYRARKEEEK